MKQKKSCVALSTAKAEYIALFAAVQESLWLNQLTSELTSSNNQQKTILKDNQSAVAMTHNPQFHGCSKLIDIKYYFIRDHTNSGNIKLVYCPTGDIVADMFTKGLSRKNFCKLRDNARIANLHLPFMLISFSFYFLWSSAPLLCNNSSFVFVKRPCASLRFILCMHP